MMAAMSASSSPVTALSRRIKVATIDSFSKPGSPSPTSLENGRAGVRFPPTKVKDEAAAAWGVQIPQEIRREEKT